MWSICFDKQYRKKIPPRKKFRKISAKQKPLEINKENGLTRRQRNVGSFKSKLGNPKGTGGVAQWIEQRFSKPLVEGSSPPAPGIPNHQRGRSSVGRALESHSRGREFEPHRLHFGEAAVPPPLKGQSPLRRLASPMLLSPQTLSISNPPQSRIFFVSLLCLKIHCAKVLQTLTLFSCPTFSVVGGSTTPIEEANPLRRLAFANASIPTNVKHF